MRIAVDAMGGDYAPAVVIEGVAKALNLFPDVQIVLVGHLEKISYYLQKEHLQPGDRLELVHAEQVVEMSEPSTASIRKKRNSSISVCAEIAAQGRVDGIVSAGHTGAAVAATKVKMHILKGVDRPALATVMPATDGNFILCDAGANTDCTPLNLAQFALMGEIYAQMVLNIERPRIGIVSIGGEDSKGNNLTKEAFKILSHMPINFVGNVEGHDMFFRETDVVVSDGFSGNLVLKTAEGLAAAVNYWLKNFLMKTPIRKAGAILAQNAFSELKGVSNFEEYGGAPLMGLNGVCIIGHGASTPKAVCNAIRVANHMAKLGLPQKLSDRIFECGVQYAPPPKNVSGQNAIASQQDEGKK